MRLTYCGNVHPAEDFDGWLAHLADCPAAVAARQPAPFGLGAWWSAAVARRVAHSADARAAVRDALAAHDLGLWTMNAFPHGGFHDASVKLAVYSPDWAAQERLAYTRDVVVGAAAVAPAGAELPISTLPLGYGAVDLHGCVSQLRAAARTCAEVADRTGVRAVLALEPEPFCALETAAGTGAFLEEQVFAGTGAEEATLRAHLGVCLDLCHLAVVGEDPLAALRDLRARGLAVPKIQVSSCLEVREAPAGPRRAALDRLLGFDEPRYLHQTVAAGGERALDLPEVRARRAEFAAAGRIRTHYHMPLYWDEDGAFGSTRAELCRFLAEVAGPLPLLEVETYTWSVLEDRGVEADTPLADRLCAELAFVREARKA